MIRVLFALAAAALVAAAVIVERDTRPYRAPRTAAPRCAP